MTLAGTQCGAQFGRDPDEVPERVTRYFRSSLHAVFADHADVVLPWRGAGRLRHRQPYDRALVAAVIGGRAGELVEIDPRVLTATQSGATRAGVDYYLNQRTYEDTGWTYADRHHPGNRIPIIYSRTNDHGQTIEMILSGHHRSLAALIAAIPVLARRVSGGYGPAA